MAGSVGKIYSDALFELASEQNCTEAVFEELNGLKAVWKDNPELSKFLSSPIIGKGDKLSAVEKIFKGKVSDIVYNFICVITEKDRGNALSEIADAYKERWYNVSGIAEVTVTTSIPISTVLKDKLVKKLEKVYGRKIILAEKVDESIIGGIVISSKNTMLDGSVKTKLDTIQKQINGIIA